MGYSWGVETNIGDRTFDEAARFIAAQPGGPERLLDKHTPDEHGRCRGCTTPGTGTPDKRWPCSTAVLAQAARTPPSS